MAVGYHSDMAKYGPKARITAVTHHWGDHYTAVAQAVLDGSWKAGDLWSGIAQGMINIAPFNDSVPQDVQDMVIAAKEAIRKGELHPFDGSVLDQDGNETIPAGRAMNDGELAKVDYYVQGVQGKLPQ